jgi:hypothetical protein
VGTTGDAVLLLVVSELFTAAVQHADRTTAFGWKPGRGRLRWRYRMPARVRPRPRCPSDASKQDGFGWHLIQDLSDESSEMIRL